MQFRLTHLMLAMAILALIVGWYAFLQRKWHEWEVRHPVVYVAEEVDGKTVMVQRRVKMYFAHNEFYTPAAFARLTLQGLILIGGTVGIAIVGFRRWPRMMWLFVKLILVGATIGFLAILILPAMQAVR